MLKRAAWLLMALLYLVTTTGFALSLHFCGDSVTALRIDAPAKAPIGCADGMKCCTNRHLVVKVKDAHFAQSQALKAKPLAFKTLSFYHPYFSFITPQGVPGSFINKSPPGPPLPINKIFLKNRVFRV